MKRLTSIIFCAALLTGCATTQLAEDYTKNVDQIVTDISGAIETTIKHWPKISGLIDGIYDGQPGLNELHGIVLMKQKIDNILLDKNHKPKPEVSDYDKWRVEGLIINMIQSEAFRILKEFRPDILKLIPAMLINL